MIRQIVSSSRLWERGNQILCIIIRTLCLFSIHALLARSSCRWADTKSPCALSHFVWDLAWYKLPVCPVLPCIVVPVSDWFCKPFFVKVIWFGMFQTMKTVCRFHLFLSWLLDLLLYLWLLVHSTTHYHWYLTVHTVWWYWRFHAPLLSMPVSHLRAVTNLFLPNLPLLWAVQFICTAFQWVRLFFWRNIPCCCL